MIGETVSHYRILERLGQGGMGVVYKAEDTRLDRTVALKFIAPELTRDPEAESRFVHEAKAASSIDHPNICTIHEIDETHDGQMFIAMAFYEGETLRTTIARGRLPLEQAVGIALQLAEGLSHAHREGVVHRDLKPGNVILTRDGTVKIVDFGLAKLGGQTKLTRVGTTVGTVSYMSPEQARGGEADARSDLWALGVTLYEMITGVLPFRGEHEQAVIRAILEEDAEPLTAIRTWVPPELQRITAKCLAKDPGGRYQTAENLAADLRDYLGLEAVPTVPHHDPAEQTIGLSDSGHPRRGRFSRNRGSSWLVWLSMLAVLGIALAYSGHRLLRSESLPETQLLQITMEPGWEGQPQISPHGTSIVFSGGANGERNIFVTSLDGSRLVQLTRDQSLEYEPTWFPDGARIAFVREESGIPSIWQINHLGGEATLLLPNATDPAISPDGSMIAFAREDEGTLRIWVAPLDDRGKARRLTDRDHGLWEHQDPAWSPGGKRIAYGTFSGLWTVSVDGDEPRQLTSSASYAADPVWSGDGKRIYFSSYREGPPGIWRVSAGGGRAHPVVLGSGLHVHPSLTRGGDRMVMSTGSVIQTLHVLNRANGAEVVLPVFGDCGMPAFSADGRDVFFMSDRYGTMEIFRCSVRGGSPPRRITELPGTESHIVVSPDGKWLAYYRILDEERDIFVLPSEGGIPERITDHPAPDYQPTWSPDGSQLAFVSERTGSAQIWAVPLVAGRRAGEPRQLTRESFPCLVPWWLPGADGIAFVGNDEDGPDVYRLPMNGGEQVKRVTHSAYAARIRWDALRQGLLVLALWGENRYSIRELALDGSGADSTLVQLDAISLFDVSPDGSRIAYSRVPDSGDIWMSEAVSGTY